MYEKDNLLEYINNSELRVFSNNIKLRLSKELVSKYDEGVYTNYLTRFQLELDMLMALKIKLPGNAKPNLYLYIVPDENFIKLLSVPPLFTKDQKGGGRPVKCYDLDGFNLAYGVSQNLLENNDDSDSISINEIHEISHIILGQFLLGNQAISEGIAEAFPLYVLNLEERYTEHKNIISTLKQDQIYNMKELITKSKNGTYGNDAIVKNKACSFRMSYISSYLFVVGILKTIEEKYDFATSDSIQYFLEILRKSRCSNEWLIYDIANYLELPKEQLLEEKKMQLKALNLIVNSK